MREIIGAFRGPRHQWLAAALNVVPLGLGYLYLRRPYGCLSTVAATALYLGVAMAVRGFISFYALACYVPPCADVQGWLNALTASMAVPLLALGAWTARDAYRKAGGDGSRGAAESKR